MKKSRLFRGRMALAIVFFPLIAFALESEHDQAYEERLARIADKFLNSSIGATEWEKIAGPHLSESYTLQSGDTLWDVSEKFFGSGFYWPKVWQLNDEITNPHEVDVGLVLKFNPGDVNNPPSVQASHEEGEEETETESTEAESSDQDTENEESDSSANLTPDVENIPSGPDDQETEEIYLPPKRPTKPVAKIPSSFPDWRKGSQAYGQTGVAITYDKVTAKKKKTALPTYFSDGPWKSSGKVVDMEDDTMTVAADYQEIGLSIPGGAKIGDVYTVFNNVGWVKDHAGKKTDLFQVETRGEVKITEVLKGSDENLYRALVLSSSLPVTMNDDLTPGRLMLRTDFSTEGPQNPVAAEVLNGQYSGETYGNRTEFAVGETVGLGRGQDDGLAVGQILPVLRNDELRREQLSWPKGPMHYDPRPIGHLRVVAVGHHSATAVIVEERQTIIPGDETGTIEMVAKLQPPPAAPNPADEAEPDLESSPDDNPSDNPASEPADGTTAPDNSLDDSEFSE